MEIAKSPITQEIEIMDRIGINPFEMTSLARGYETTAEYWKTVLGPFQYENFPYVSVYREMLSRSNRKTILDSGFFDFMGQFLSHLDFDFKGDSPANWRNYRNIRKLGTESPFNADLCAKDAREFMRLDDSPVKSVQDLLTDLGIPVMFVSRGKKIGYMHPSLNAIGVSLPKPCILIAYDSEMKQDYLRMVLAYSLGWFLLERGSIPSLTEDVLMFNPNDLMKDIEPWRFMKDFTARNKRAKIFASYFLAPPMAVLKLIGNNRKSDFTLENIRKISLTFGIPHICSLKTLKNLCSSNDSPISKDDEFNMVRKINGIANNIKFQDNAPKEPRDLEKAVKMWKNVFLLK